MFKIALLVLAAVLVQDSQACCCTSREPYMTKTCLELLFGLCECDSLPPKCGCFKNAKNPLASSCAKPCSCSPVLYYPEVEYPITNYNVKPFYYNTCFGY